MNNSDTYKSIDQNCFSVMTINLRFGLADDGPNSWKYRKVSYNELFKRYAPDFICMQESNNFQIDYFETILGNYNYIGKRQGAPNRWQDNIIFYRASWNCLEYNRFYLSHTPTIPSKLFHSKWPRQCSIGIFNKGPHTLICTNTHLDFDEVVQVQSIHILLDLLSDYPASCPIIILGDFNAKPHSPCYRTLTSTPVNGKYFKEIFETDYSSTYHGFSEIQEGMHIDWILYSGSVSPGKKEIITQKINNYHPSDHFPVFAEFEWCI